MKNTISDVQKSLYKDIIINILFILVSIPLWLSFDISALETAKMYDNYNYVEYEFLNAPTYSLNPVSDEYAIRNIETQDLIVYNNSNTNENYALVLKINKNSTANIDKLKINVNYQISYLKDYSSYEDDKNTYYVIAQDNIVANSQKYVLSMWNDETADVNNNDTLNYEFMII